MAPRTTAACALAALLLALAASDSHAGLFDLFNKSDDDTTAAPVTSTESSGGGSRSPSKNSRLRGDLSPTIEMYVLRQGATGKGKGRGKGKGSGGRSRHQSKASATIVVVPTPSVKVPKGTTEQTPEEATMPPELPAPAADQRAGSIFPPTVITETVRMEDGQMVATVDVPPETPMVAGNGLGPVSSPTDGQIGGFPGNGQSVWGPYPTELNSPQFDFTGMDQMPFPYGYNSFPSSSWQTPPFMRARNAWYPMPQVPYRPWRSYRYDLLPPMMNPYTQIYLRGRDRRQTVLPQDLVGRDDCAEDVPLGPWPSYFNNQNALYSGWPPYMPPMRMYVSPYTYPWGPFSTSWISRPLPHRCVHCAPASDAVGQSPSLSPPHADAQSDGGAEQSPKQGDALQQSHHIRHSKHRHYALMRLPAPSWQFAQMQHPRWPAVASLPQLLPFRRYNTSPLGPAFGPSGPSPSPPPPPPTLPPGGGEDDALHIDD